MAHDIYDRTLIRLSRQVKHPESHRLGMGLGWRCTRSGSCPLLESFWHFQWRRRQATRAQASSYIWMAHISHSERRLGTVTGAESVDSEPTLVAGAAPRQGSTSESGPTARRGEIFIPSITISTTQHRQSDNQGSIYITQGNYCYASI
jgi:hypothetical protein